MSDADEGAPAGVGRVGLRYGVATDVGRVRHVNEDSYLAHPPVFVVADGMGGHDGGDIASRMVVEEFARLADSGYDPRRGTQAVLSTLRSAQRRLLEYGATHRGSDGRAWHGGTTTVVAMLVDGEDAPEWLLTNLGDSRIYRFGRGGLDQVSTDHSVVQGLLDSGRISPEEAIGHPERHIVTRALGGPDPLEPDFFHVPLADAQRVLLCSDGITDLVRDDVIGRLLDEHADPREAAERIVTAALDAGGVDNATALVVDVVGLADDRTDDRAGDSLRRRESPIEKLGALP